MTCFEEREKAFEAEFLRDREWHFRIVARRNKLLGVWAAKCLGLWGKVAEDYAIAVVDSEIVGRGDEAVIDKLKVDLWKCAVPITEREIREQLKAFDTKAQKEFLNQSIGPIVTP
jgi:hypothetical protein